MVTLVSGLLNSTTDVDAERAARTLGRAARMASSARVSLDARRAELAALHVEITRASTDFGRSAVVIDQAVDLRRELQSDHADARGILHALHSVIERGGLAASALTPAPSSAATLVLSTNAAAYSLGPISRCLIDELELSAARTVATLSERFIETAVFTSLQLDHQLLAAVRQCGRGRPGRHLEA